MEDPRLKDAEQELERERLAMQKSQEDERKAALQNQSENAPAQPEEASESTLDSTGGGLSESSNSSDKQ